MARKPKRLKVRQSEFSERSLNLIWLWNAENYSESHAVTYLQFLLDRTARLEATYKEGRIISSHPTFRYQSLRRGRHGHYHVVVYEVLEDEIHVINYFHSAQDWQTLVSDDPA